MFSASLTSPFLRLLICQFVYPFIRLYALFPFSILCICVFYKRFFDREASFNERRSFIESVEISRSIAIEFFARWATNKFSLL